jgi:hypothetical protein
MGGQTLAAMRGWRGATSKNNVGDVPRRDLEKYARKKWSVKSSKPLSEEPGGPLHEKQRLTRSTGRS